MKIIKEYKYKIAAIIIVIAVALVSAVMTQKPKVPEKKSGLLTVHFLDVGEADSVYIELPDGKIMLIDAGEVQNGDEVAKYIKDRGTNKVDFLIGTHPHADHIGGLAKVIESFDIGKIYMPKAYHNSVVLENVLLAVKEKQKTIYSPVAGVAIYKAENLSVDVLSPKETEYTNLNNYSIVIRITYKDTSFLFTGDAENEVLTKIEGDVSADVLKVAHHGANTSGDAEFMKRVSPRFAVISVGEGNQYGHPHNKVLSLLEEVGAKVYRTDTDGTVIVSSDGEKIKATALGDKK